MGFSIVTATDMRGPLSGASQIVVPLDGQFLDEAADDDLIAVESGRILPLAAGNQLAEALAERIGDVLLELFERRLPAVGLRRQRRQRTLGDQVAAVDTPKRDGFAALGRHVPLPVVLDAEAERRAIRTTGRGPECGLGS